MTAQNVEGSSLPQQHTHFFLPPPCSLYLHVHVRNMLVSLSAFLLKLQGLSSLPPPPKLTHIIPYFYYSKDSLCNFIFFLIVHQLQSRQC